jgi:hypothetical protein
LAHLLQRAATSLADPSDGFPGWFFLHMTNSDYHERPEQRNNRTVCHPSNPSRPVRKSTSALALAIGDSASTRC